MDDTTTTTGDYILDVGDFITFDVQLELAAHPAPKTYKFSLTAKRLYKNTASTNPESKDDFLLDHLTDWHGQTLVKDRAGNPVPFSREALRPMLNLFGVTETLWNAYIAALVKAAGPEGKAKN